MKTRGKNRRGDLLAGGLLVIALAGLLLGFAIGAWASWASENESRGVGAAQAGGDLVAQKNAARDKTSPATPKGSGLRVSFRQDPAYTRGMYMGDLWVSPPTFSAVREGKEITLDARVEGIGTKGEKMAEWVPEDPEFVTVTPSRGKAVKINVRRAGQGTLKVSAQGVSKILTIKAAYEGSAIRVDVSP